MLMIYKVFNRMPSKNVTYETYKEQLKAKYVT